MATTATQHAVEGDLPTGTFDAAEVRHAVCQVNDLLKVSLSDRKLLNRELFREGKRAMNQSLRGPTRLIPTAAIATEETGRKPGNLVRSCSQSCAGFLPAQDDFSHSFAQFPAEWRRRESNPRRGSAQIESEEDPDLATDGASDSAPKPEHKQLGRKGSGPSDLPFIHPGQMALFGRDDFGG